MSIVTISLFKNNVIKTGESLAQLTETPVPSSVQTRSCDEQQVDVVVDKALRVVCHHPINRYYGICLTWISALQTPTHVDHSGGMLLPPGDKKGLSLWQNAAVHGIGDKRMEKKESNEDVTRQTGRTTTGPRKQASYSSAAECARNHVTADIKALYERMTAEGRTA